MYNQFELETISNFIFIEMLNNNIEIKSISQIKIKPQSTTDL